MGKRNDMKLPGLRLYELRYFCWQYRYWKEAYEKLSELDIPQRYMDLIPRKYQHTDPTARIATARAFYAAKMEMVENTANRTDPELADYILKGAGYGYSYDQLQAQFQIPCCKKTYYDRLKRFYWLLDDVKE